MTLMMGCYTSWREAPKNEGCYTSFREAPKNEIHDLTIQIRTLAGWLTTVTGHGKLASRTIASYLRWCYYATLGWNRVSLAAFGLYGT